ncbi:unnamed protein product [Allacma fusca]|uniref:Uncharacterized protein n=1 Tax=Allacma fusca TaxID=39272 RepID=A0A8J2NM56_9HEXA|nr:unnamed protein product [Allacma fusca]
MGGTPGAICLSKVDSLSSSLLFETQRSGADSQRKAGKTFSISPCFVCEDSHAVSVAYSQEGKVSAVPAWEHYGKMRREPTEKLLYICVLPTKWDELSTLPGSGRSTTCVRLANACASDPTASLLSSLPFQAFLTKSSLHLPLHRSLPPITRVTSTTPRQSKAPRSHSGTNNYPGRQFTPAINLCLTCKSITPPLSYLLQPADSSSKKDMVISKCKQGHDMPIPSKFDTKSTSKMKILSVVSCVSNCGQ